MGLHYIPEEGYNENGHPVDGCTGCCFNRSKEKQMPCQYSHQVIGNTEHDCMKEKIIYKEHQELESSLEKAEMVEVPTPYAILLGFRSKFLMDDETRNTFDEILELSENWEVKE